VTILTSGIGYESAARLVPEQGNAHNQLAVLATYEEDEVSVLLWDIVPRSISIIIVITIFPYMI